MADGAPDPGLRRGRLGDLAVPPRGEAFATIVTIGAPAATSPPATATAATTAASAPAGDTPAATVVVEEIASSASPDPTAYRQDHDEWVVLLAGAATLDVAGAEVGLGPGDWVLLPAGTPHRVVATAAGSRWLAVHVHP